jgi:hypothetical protein
LSACHQIRHEATSSFYKHCVFKATPRVLNKFKNSTVAPGSSSWKEIQIVQILSADVNSWRSRAKITGVKDYVGVLPALRHVQVLDNHWGFVVINNSTLANMLGTTFGKQGLEVSVLSR